MNTTVQNVDGLIHDDGVENHKTADSKHPEIIYCWVRALIKKHSRLTWTTNATKQTSPFARSPGSINRRLQAVLRWATSSTVRMARNYSTTPKLRHK